MMLKQTDGSYACVAESPTRFTLGEVCAIKAFNLLSIVVLIQPLRKVTALIDVDANRRRKSCCRFWDYKKRKEAHLSFCAGDIRFSTLSRLFLSVSSMCA